METSLGWRLTPIRSPAALGRVVRDTRLRAGLTQVDLADRVLTSRQTIIALEAGHETRAICAMYDTLAALGLELTIRPRGA